MSIDFLRSREITESVRRMLAFVRTFDVISLARKPQMSKQQVNLLEEHRRCDFANEALNRDQYGSTKAATVRRVGSYGQ